ncbi:hypothetical protein [Bacillus sp. JJ1764]|uniref:hypothetical protein n=1 Tax=Bacillus sp. JJ1764 TaxID=3122964 RepID=UPI002FFF07A8
MNFQFDLSFKLIAILVQLLVWCITGIIAYRIYIKQQVKPEIWKVIVCILAGIFCFSINITLWDQQIKIPILPLGVWILYGILRRRDRWQSYRLYAWLGFYINLLFLLSTMLSIPVQNTLYPADRLSTYISNISHSSVVVIHPSGEKKELDQDSFLEQIHTIKKANIHGQQWYYELNGPETGTKERFPYLLIGTTSKWGSGVKPVIYIEADGKGILVSSSQKQLYFRSKAVLLKGGE